MNKINNDIISNKIQTAYQNITDKYSNNNILGVFVTGLANYGFAEKEEDISLTAIYLPTFDELCLSVPKVWFEFDTRIIDIRLMYNVARVDKWDSMELLFCQYQYINPLYENTFRKCFLNKNETISKFCPKVRMKKAAAMLESALQAGNYFEAARIRTSATLYMMGIPTAECYHLNQDCYTFYLWGVKNGEVEVDKEVLLNEMKKYIAEASDEISIEAETAIKNGVVKIMSLALMERAEFETFENSLTDMEKIALADIKNAIPDGAGNIVISKIVNNSTVSRPVFKNLLLKLEQNNIAKVENQGVKGMYVEFL